MSTHSEDSPRVILIVSNAAAAHPTLSHDGVKSGIGVDRVSAATAGWLAAREGVDGSISSVFLLNLVVPLALHPEKDTTSNCEEDDCSDHHPHGNSNCV